MLPGADNDSRIKEHDSALLLMATKNCTAVAMKNCTLVAMRGNAMGLISH